MARGKENKWMPSNVFKNKYSYYIKNLTNRSITLFKITSTRAELWPAFEKFWQKKYKLLFKDLWGNF